jgi:hypothetical protein
MDGWRRQRKLLHAFRKTRSHKEFRVTIWQRWKQTALHNKALVLSSVIMAFGTLFYSVAAIVQLCMFNSSSEQAAQQTAKLIDAANINASAAEQIAAASKRNATAAESFAISGEKIHQGVDSAVRKLSIQAGALGRSADQGRRLADETHKANAYAVESDRAWMAVRIYPENPDAENPLKWKAVFPNAGRSPALVIKTMVSSRVLPVFTIPPSYEGEPPDVEHGQSLVVPGDYISSEATAQTPLGAPSMNAVNAGLLKLYAYGEVFYRSPTNNILRHTYGCVIWVPKDKRWVNCGEYNDAD